MSDNSKTPGQTAAKTAGAWPRHGRTSDPQGRPDAPTGLSAASWWSAVKRIAGEFRDDNLPDWAAALTYYSVLAIFPSMLVVVSLLGLGGASLSNDLVTNVGDLAPGSVKQVLGNALTELQRGRSGASLAAVLGLAAALWSASGYVGAFMRASNAVYDVPEGRPIWKTLPTRIAITLVTLVLMSASAIAVVVTGPLAEKAGDILGVGSAALTIWGIAKWPALLVVVGLLFTLLYWASPNAKHGFRWVTGGVIVAMLVWLAASAGFALFVANFGSYNKTYGTLAGVIIFLIWLWLSNIAILLGAELNAELERGRAIAGGHPEDKEPYVRPRDTRKIDDDNLRDNEFK
jgi:membrane protein